MIYYDILSWLTPDAGHGPKWVIVTNGEKEASFNKLTKLIRVHHNCDGVMPLRIIRVLGQPSINKEDALRIALTTSTLAKELSNLSAFPPIIAASSILLIIFQTVQVSTIEN